MKIRSNSLFAKLTEDQCDALVAVSYSMRLDELVKVVEENAKLGWRKLECENARSGVKLLPKVRELLMDATRKPEERLAMALECLGVEGGKLLTAGSEAVQAEG